MLRFIASLSVLGLAAGFGALFAPFDSAGSRRTV